MEHDLRKPKPASFLSRFTSPKVTQAVPIEPTPIAAPVSSPVAAAAPIASSAPAAPAAPGSVPVRPKRTFVDGFRRMFTPTNPEWQRYADDRGVPDSFLRRDLPEATQVEHQVYQPGPGGRRKTRRKV